MTFINEAVLPFERFCLIGILESFDFIVICLGLNNLLKLQILRWYA